jgi:hypothetical protein
LQPQTTRAHFIRRKQSEAMEAGREGGWPIKITS